MCLLVHRHQSQKCIQILKMHIHIRVCLSTSFPSMGVNFLEHHVNSCDMTDLLHVIYIYYHEQRGERHAWNAKLCE